jgi:hypothetical protein
MDQYALAFLVLAATYIVVDITKYMADVCVRRNYLRDISIVLNEMNKKLQEMPFEAVCLCEVCAPPATAAAEKRRPSVAAVLSAHHMPTSSEKIEHIAIGISDSGSDSD